MAQKVPSFLKMKDRTLYYSGTGEFVFFIPEVFFDRKHAIYVGEFINCIGVLNYAVSTKPGETTFKNIKRFNYPTTFLTRPGSVEKVKNFKLIPDRAPEDYRILRYKDNGEDQVVCSIDTPNSIDNVEEFFQIFVTTGKIPAGIPYDKLHEMFLETMAVNGSSWKINNQLFGILVSKLCRDPKDLSKVFRLSNAINNNMESYASISVKDVSKYTSPFSAINSENWDEAVVSAMVMDNDKKETSPMEKVMMGD